MPDFHENFHTNHEKPANRNSVDGNKELVIFLVADFYSQITPSSCPLLHSSVLFYSVRLQAPSIQ